MCGSGSVTQNRRIPLLSGICCGHETCEGNPDSSPKACCETGLACRKLKKTMYHSIRTAYPQLVYWTEPSDGLHLIHGCGIAHLV